MILHLYFLKYISLNDKNRVFYLKYFFDPGIQVWLVDFKEAPGTQIAGASYPNYQLSRPNFLPCRHVWNFHVSAVSVDLP